MIFSSSFRNLHPFISVVVPVGDIRLDQILKLVSSIAEQTYPNKEIILVNSSGNRQISNTFIAHGFRAQVINARVSKAVARNIGVARSRGEIILHLDADMVLTRGILASCALQHRNGYDAIVIPEEIRGSGFLTECRRLEKQCYENDKIIEAARSVTRKIHKKIGGFDVATGDIDEYAFQAKIERAGAQIARIEEPIIINESILNLSKKFKHGRYSRIYLRKYPEKARPQFSPIRRSVQYSELIRAHPFHFFTIALLKSLELIAFITGSLFGAPAEAKDSPKAYLLEDFDKVATTYLHAFNNTIGGQYLDQTERKAIVKMTEHVQTQNSDRPIAIDIGMGPGRLTNIFSDRDFYTVGINHSHTMCKIAKKRHHNPNFETIQADMTFLPIRGGRVDLAVSFRSAKYLADIRKLFEETNRTLKPTGIFLLELPNAFSPFYLAGKPLSKIAKRISTFPTIEYMAHAQQYTRAKCSNMMVESGLKPIATEGISVLPQAIVAKIHNRFLLKIIKVAEEFIIQDLRLIFLSRSLLFAASNS